MTDVGENVQYSIEKTPTVEEILPRWGAVSGGTVITFKGSNLLAGVDQGNVDLNDY